MTKEQISAVELKYGHLTSQIKNLKAKDWERACGKLGIWLAPGGGKGSHTCGYKTENCDRSVSSNLVITIQRHLTPNIQTDKLKQLVAFGLESGQYTEEDVWRALGFKV